MCFCQNICPYIIQLPLCICNGSTSMFAQEDGAVVMKLEKMNDVMVDEKSKVIIQLFSG